MFSSVKPPKTTTAATDVSQTMEEALFDDAARNVILQEEEDTDVSMRFLTEEVLTSSDEEEGQHGGSKVGRAPNKKRDFTPACQRVVNNYFNGPQSVYDDKDFECRFRMSRRIFNQIYDAVMGTDPFVQKKDCLGKLGIHPLVKLHIAYGDAYDCEDENLCIGEATLPPMVKRYCKIIKEEFGPRHLNKTPTLEERHAIFQENSKRGFPGCIASWDCKHFVWKNCPLRLAGQHQGHAEGGRKTLMLEAICDHRNESMSESPGT